MTLESVRVVVMRRDSIDDNAFEEMLGDYSLEVSEGADPEEALQDVFGLEPDYLFDDEIQDCLGDAL